MNKKFHEVRRHTAFNKKFACAHCHQEISFGELYRRATNDRDKYHLRCIAVFVVRYGVAPPKNLCREEAELIEIEKHRLLIKNT